MLVLPGPPVSFPRRPSEKSGEYAIPARGAKLLYRVGASVLGIPGSPGTTQPLGAVGKTTDCSPGTMVSIFPCVSYHGMLTSHRRPRFTVRLGFTLYASWINNPP